MHKTEKSKSKKRLSQTTIKVLCIRSGNQCADPECTEPLLQKGTGDDEDLVLGEICHIHAASKDGPRGSGDLTEEELRSPKNLIMLCEKHHHIIDAKDSIYSADMLKKMKQSHESKVQERMSLGIVDPKLFSHPYFPIELVDKKINEDIDILRRSWFFTEFNRTHFSLTLAKKIAKEELSRGTEAVRVRALAWCARILSTTEYLQQAEEYLNLAQASELKLETSPEINVARAFIFSKKGDKDKALSSLASIDLPISKSAAFMIVEQHKGTEGAIEWLGKARYSADDLDSDGKFFLLVKFLESSRWDDAARTLDMIKDQDLDETPVLYHAIAITHLLGTVPDKYRAFVRDQVPHNVASFPLASNETAIKARREALRYFTNALKVAQKFKCPNLAMTEDKYALWLELRDPQKSYTGKQKLEIKLCDPEHMLLFVSFGYQFDIKLNSDIIEREIEKQKALHREITLDVAIARITLAFMQGTPEERVDYLERHYKEISKCKYINEEWIRALQINLFWQAGLSGRAYENLDLLIEKGLSESEKRYYLGIIGERDGKDLVEIYQTQYEKTQDLEDLENLVIELEKSKKWDDLCKYGKLLFKETKSDRDAMRYSSALYYTYKTKSLIAFLKLKQNRYILEHSGYLKMLLAKALYHEGKFLEARSELGKISEEQKEKDRDYPALLVNLEISLGDWRALFEFVAAEYQQRENRNARSLIAAAQLAFSIDYPYAKDLTFAAVDKASDDAHVLAAAYFLALNADWKDDKTISEWLYKAAELSGSDGPIQKITLRDIHDQKPIWEHQVSETQRLLSQGDIPMFVAAQSLNQSLIELMLSPALINLSESLSESDVRRKGIVPAYGGTRQPVQLDKGGIVGMEVTTLLTLGFLDLLDEAFDIFDKVYMPHSTLKWLFEEKQNATFHQPRQIKYAEHIRDLLSRHHIEEFTSSIIAGNELSELSEQVGEELARLIVEAKTANDDDIQRIVVRPFPVYRLGSSMEEEADLTEYASVVSSCMSVIDKLQEKGQITIGEAEKARAYLKFQEKPWPNQPRIMDEAILYLDGLAVTHLVHLKMLEKLQAAGLKPIISSQRVSELNALISHKYILYGVNKVIKRIQSAVTNQIMQEKIKMIKQHDINGRIKLSKYEHPTLIAASLPEDCRVIISDDRYINQYMDIRHGGSHVSIFSTIDLLNTLTSASSITPEVQMEKRTMLRRAGYFLISVTDEEFMAHLKAATVSEGHIDETAELKAIRENILQVQMNSWLQHPKDLNWLNDISQVFIRVLKRLWLSTTNLSEVKILSNWIADQIDIRSWAHAFGEEHGKFMLENGWCSYVLALITPPHDAPQDIKDKYMSWAQDKFLAPLKEQYPDLYTQIVERGKILIIDIINTKLIEGKDHVK